jgi:hypothetical protein
VESELPMELKQYRSGLGSLTYCRMKMVAEKPGIPYQVLIRVFILDGLERLKRAG